jgi:hypothetical protein
MENSGGVTTPPSYYGIRGYNAWRASYVQHDIAIQISTPVNPRSIKMKYAFAALLAVASTTSAHYTFPELVVGSTKTGQWNYVRKTANYQSNGMFPITSSIQFKFHLTSLRSYDRCNG